MLTSSSRRLLAPQNRLLLQVRHSWGQNMSYRDVFVEDNSFDYLTWIKDNSLHSAQIKHPSSTHVVSKYAAYVHNHGSYNFNNVDDYVLNIAAYHQLPAVNSESNKHQTTSNNTARHALLVWPDSLVLSNLVADDIAVIGKNLLKDAQLEKTKLAAQLNPSAVVLPITDVTIILSVSSVFTYTQALRTKEWFESTFQTHNYAQKVNYFIASEIKARNQLPAQVTVLPLGIHFEDVHSLKKVENIVVDICSKSSM